jgi:carboxylesterase type B
MRRAWVEFARTGQPGLPQWEAYRPGEDNYLAFGDQAAPRAGWRTAQLDFIERYYRSVIPA